MSELTPNDTITSIRVNLGGRRPVNPYQRGTSEWAAWEAGYAANRKPHPFGSNGQ